MPNSITGPKSQIPKDLELASYPPQCSVIPRAALMPDTNALWGVQRRLGYEKMQGKHNGVQSSRTAFILLKDLENDISL